MMKRASWLAVGILAILVGVQATAVAQVNVPAGVARLQALRPGVQIRTSAGQVRRLFGSSLGSSPTAQATVDEFVANHARDVFGVDPLDLVPTRAQTIGNGRYRLMVYEQHMAGIPVEGAALRLLVRLNGNNDLVLASATLQSADRFVRALGPVLAPLTGAQAIAALQPQHADLQFGPPHLVFFIDGGVPVLAYKTIGDNGTLVDPVRMAFYLDAATGNVIGTRDLIHYTDVDGHIGGFATPGVFPDTGTNPPTAQDLTSCNVSISGGNSAVTDALGDFTIANPGSTTVTVNAVLNGIFTRVIDQAGSDLSESVMVLPPGPANLIFNSNGITELSTAQVNGYVETTRVHDFIVGIDPAFPLHTLQLPCNVNIASSCNAFYDGASINMFQSGGSCVNTAYSTVIWHEYGHFVVDSAQPFAAGDYHEGMADVVASFLGDDNIVGRDFRGPGTMVRDVDNPNFQWPVGNGDPHIDGLAIAGAFWDTRTNLMADMGAGPGATHADFLFLNSISVGTGTISPDVTIDVLTLDDDDANLNNGTPNRSAICAGFDNHSLNCPQLVLLDFSYPGGRPTTTPPGTPLTITVAISSAGETLDPTSPALDYAIDGVGFGPVPMTSNGAGDFQAQIPAPSCGATLSFFISADTIEGSTVTDPAGAPASSFPIVVATGTVMVLDDDFEADQGWTVGDPNDPDTATTGTWDRADPEGTSNGSAQAQPEDDHTAAPGTDCWVTDSRAGASLGSFDVDNGKTTLMSPTLDLSGVDATISYWRWYSNHTGASPFADVLTVDISTNNGTTWSNLETVGPATESSGGWISHDLLVSEFVTPTSTVKVRFVASDLGSGSLVEAAIDDFQAVSFVCSVGGDGDADIDGDVDVADYGAMQRCSGQAAVGACAPLDMDGSGTVDAGDVPLFATALSTGGPN